MQCGADRLASGGFAGQAADVHFSPVGQQQRAGDGGGGHDQDIGLLALAAEREALGDAEAVLFVDDGEREVPVFDGVLEQRVGADDQGDGAVFQAP